MGEKWRRLPPEFGCCAFHLVLSSATEFQTMTALVAKGAPPRELACSWKIACDCPILA
jgi:hypothetical protein